MPSQEEREADERLGRLLRVDADRVLAFLWEEEDAPQAGADIIGIGDSPTVDDDASSSREREDEPSRAARWPLAVAAAVIVLVVLGAGVLALRDPEPAPIEVRTEVTTEPAPEIGPAPESTAAPGTAEPTAPPPTPEPEPTTAPTPAPTATADPAELIGGVAFAYELESLESDGVARRVGAFEGFDGESISIAPLDGQSVAGFTYRLSDNDLFVACEGIGRTPGGDLITLLATGSLSDRAVEVVVTCEPAESIATPAPTPTVDTLTGPVTFAYRTRSQASDGQAVAIGDFVGFGNEGIRITRLRNNDIVVNTDEGLSGTPYFHTCQVGDRPAAGDTVFFRATGEVTGRSVDFEAVCLPVGISPTPAPTCPPEPTPVQLPDSTQPSGVWIVDPAFVDQPDFEDWLNTATFGPGLREQVVAYVAELDAYRALGCG